MDSPWSHNQTDTSERLSLSLSEDSLPYRGLSQVAQMVKNLPAVAGDAGLTSVNRSVVLCTPFARWNGV